VEHAVLSYCSRWQNKNKFPRSKKILRDRECRKNKKVRGRRSTPFGLRSSEVQCPVSFYCCTLLAPFCSRLSLHPLASEPTVYFRVFTTRPYYPPIAHGQVINTGINSFPLTNNTYFVCGNRFLRG
jgi:hypothetical protein